MKAFVTYTLLRIALFLGVYVVLGVAWRLIVGPLGTDAFFVLVVASAVISSVLSLRLLGGPRDRLARGVQARAARTSARFEERKAREDLDIIDDEEPRRG